MNIPSDMTFWAVCANTAITALGFMIIKFNDFSHLEKNVIFRLDKGHDASDEIMEAAEELGIDLIVLGSKGRSDPAAFLLGSLAEKLVQRNYSTPVLIEKHKGTVMKFLEALLNV